MALAACCTVTDVSCLNVSVILDTLSSPVPTVVELAWSVSAARNRLNLLIVNGVFYGSTSHVLQRIDPALGRRGDRGGIEWGGGCRHGAPGCRGSAGGGV